MSNLFFYEYQTANQTEPSKTSGVVYMEVNSPIDAERLEESIRQHVRKQGHVAASVKYGRLLSIVRI